MASDVRLVSSRLVSDPRGGNVRGTAEEGEIVIKEEMEDEAPLVEVQMKPNEVQIKTENDGAPFLAGNLLPVTIKEEGEEEMTPIVNPTSTANPVLYKCHLCPAAFTDYQITREHIRGHSVGYRSCVCSTCQQAFYSVSELCQHQLEHGNCHKAPSTSEAEEQPTDQALIQEVATTPKSSNRPSTSTSSRKSGRYKCSLCQASFPDSQTTLEHIRCHGYGFRSRRCPDCDQAFCTKAELSKHQDEHHPKSNLESKPTVQPFPRADKLYNCSICWRTFQHSSSLRRHEKSHAVVSALNVPSKEAKTQELDSKESANQIEVSIKEENEVGILQSPTSKLNLNLPTSTPESAINMPPEASPKRATPSPIQSSTSGKFSCEFCGKTYRTRYNFTVHLRQHTGERPYLCTVCTATFTNRGHLKRHEKKSHGKAEPRSFPCSTCARTYTNSGSLWLHTRQKHPAPGTEPLIRPNRHLCQVCGKGFLSPCQLADHTRSRHTGERPYGCPDCDFRGTSKSALAMHKKVHTRVRVKQKKTRSKASPSPSPVFPCPHCPRTYANPYSLDRHLTTKHPSVATQGSTEGGLSSTEPKPSPSPLTFPCPHCPRSYAYNEARRLHIRMKHPEPGTEPFVLPRRHVCSECDKAFPSPSHLADHGRAVHTGERPYACEQCHFRASRRYDLLKHTRKHTGGEKKAQLSTTTSCPQCTRVFYEKSKLAKHLKEHHEGASPWSCDQCGALYGGKMELVRHRRQKHGEGRLHQAKRRKVEMDETEEEAKDGEDEVMDEEEMDEIAMFQDHPEVKEEFEDQEKEEIVFCKTIK